MLLFAAAAHAEEEKYIKHVTSFFDAVECEKINVENPEPKFHLDSDGVSMPLNAAAMPVNTTDKELEYTSSNPDIVSVDKNGVMYSKNVPGDVTITISCGSVKREITVSVIRGVTGLSLSRTDMLFYADRPISAKIEPIISPADATDKRVKWKSENTDIAVVDENGTVTPCGVGTANIVAETADGGFKAFCIVRVSVYDVPVRGVFLTNAPDAIQTGTAYKLSAHIYPQNAREKALEYTSSDPAVVSVDADGTMHGAGEGMAVITCRSKNGAEDYFTISCVPNDGSPFSYNIISEPVEERIAKLSMPVFYAHYTDTLSAAVSAQMKAEPVTFDTNASPASSADVEKYLNPQNYTKGYGKYQFLDLSVSNGVSADMLNTYLTGKGVLAGKGEVFKNAALANGISEIYLCVHAALESGNGKSKLASGTEYNSTTVYNLFGIGAVDQDPENAGAKYAYEKGWTSIDAAIYGGAEWISKNYINNGQNTLYKMRWNPKSPGTHQYATDVAWAIKQARSISPLAQACPNAALTFDFPIYSGQSEVPISYE